jgi:hypothetical protein
VTRGWLGAGLAALACVLASPAAANDRACELGATVLTADAPVAIVGAAIEQLPGGGDRYCLVRVRVGGTVNLLVGLPMDGRWNGNIQAEGKGGYGGQLAAPVRSVARGFVGVASDTGHPASARDPEETPTGEWRDTNGAFAMLAPGKPNLALQNDFAHRSAHLMAVIARQLAAAFYGRPARHAFYFGCSTEGRQALRAAQHYPADYDGILAGDPAVRFAQVMAYQIWPQLVMRERAGGPILAAKLDLASSRAVAVCDKSDGLADGLLTDPRRCRYRAARDRKIVRASCRAGDGMCLSPAEAGAIEEIWRGPKAADGRLLWRGIERGAPLGLLAGARPFPYALLQPRYWVYLDPEWDWRSLTIATYPAFFARSVAAVNPVMAPDEPNLAAFFARGGKILAYHGFNDAGILPHGSIDYYEAAARRTGLSLRQLQAHFQLYMLPGVGHCGGGDAPQPPVDRMLDALVGWVERGTPPHGLVAVQEARDRGPRSRPLCAWPTLPYYRGMGDPDLAASFRCR